MNFRPTQARIDLRRLSENYRALECRAERGAWVVPMVKANAYGHGSIFVSRALRQCGAKALGVALIEEGLQLREDGDLKAVLIFSHFLDSASAEAAVSQNFEVVVGSIPQLEVLANASRRLGPKIKVHIELDIGMNRVGFEVAESASVAEWLARHPEVEVRSILTHLPEAESREASLPQLQLFALAYKPLEKLQVPVHIFNSAGIANLSAGDLSGVTLLHSVGLRPGLALYGVQPETDTGRKALDVNSVLELRSQIVRLRHLRAGERVSYGGTWRAERDSIIGVVPCGYADGYRRELSNGGSIALRGMRAKVVGTVCMDYFMTDLTDTVSKTGEVNCGEEVILIGDLLPANEVAKRCGTIAYEILTAISSRVPRIYINGGGAE